ncbi:hypothetical protein VTP01DRAFT_5149 [Rhizomucor pusillus]|uniref:uncharacterized protein n=1 Tax=Rhizomucor pusillus TaxID=4840 RepID=UPI0037422615
MEHPQTSTAEAGEAGPMPTQPSIPENERQHTVDTSSETPDRTLDESRQFKRNPISYGENELRRRHVKSVDKDDTNAQSETAASSEPAVNHHSGNAGFYECNICFDTATHPVLTLCGHLFCWSCLAQWLHAQSRNPTCPVCKAGCGRDKVIPVYGRGREEKDPRTDPSIPTRPAGQRPPPLRDPNAPATSLFGQPLRGTMYNAGGNVSFSAGISLFPPFAFTFNIPTNTTNTGFHAQPAQNAFMSRLIMMVISLLIIAIIFS